MNSMRITCSIANDKVALCFNLRRWFLDLSSNLGLQKAEFWDRSGCWKLLKQQNQRKPNDYCTGWVQQLEFLLMRVFSLRTERATLWRHDQTKDFTNCAFRHLRRCILLENWHPGAHGFTTVGKLHCIFWFRNRCYVQISLQRNAEKKCPGCLPFQIC